MVLSAKDLARYSIMLTAFLVMLSPLAATVSASTPVADPPVITVEPVTPDPEPTETETVEPEPTETETVEPEPTETETVEPEPTETEAPDGDATPDGDPEEVTGPDQLQVVGDTDIQIAPGEYRDIVIRYTLGSDRENTEIAARLTAPGGESLANWEIVPLYGTDTQDDPEDPDRHLKARIDYTDNIDNGDVFETTWRVTAPDHLESPVLVRINFLTSIHGENGVVDGVIKENLISINAIASVHNPTLECEAVVAEDVRNTWNCVVDTDHPGDDVAVAASANVPDGWELTLDDMSLNAESTHLAVDENGTRSFTLAAVYPIGCPDQNAAFSSTLGLTFSYQSGDTLQVSTELPIVFVNPQAELNITSFSFEVLDDIETLSTTGQLTLQYSNAPCGWQATLEFGDLASPELGVIDGVIVSATGVDGLSEDASVTMIDNTIVIIAPESTDEVSEGEIVIHLQLDLPHLILPGDYVIKVLTELVLSESL